MAKKKKEKQVPRSIRFPKELDKKVEKDATEQDRSFSKIVVKIVEQHYEKK